MRILMVTAVVLLALRFTKWPNWKEYYPTALFMMVLNLAASVVTHNHRLWIYLPSGVLTTHTMSDLFETFTVLPAVACLYLSHYPSKRVQQLYYVLAWIPTFLCVELFMEFMGLFTYENGWSAAWSAAFDCVMFPILRIHYTHPLLAWGLSAAFFIFIWIHFGFSADLLK